MVTFKNPQSGNTCIRVISLVFSLAMLFCVLLAGFTGKGFQAYADLGGGGDFGFGGDDGFNLGGDDGFDKALEVVLSDADEDADGHTVIAGIDLNWLQSVRENPLIDITNLLIKIHFRIGVGNNLFKIADNAFNCTRGDYDGLVFTALKFLNKADYSWDPEGESPEGLSASYLAAIGDNAFQRGAFKTADMSGLDNLTVIGEYAFNECAALTAVNLSGSAIKSIGDYAFAGCGELYSVNLNGCLGVSLGEGAFENCIKLTALDLKTSGVEIIGDRAFGSCLGLKQIDFSGAPVTTIGEQAFYNTGIETLDLTGLKNLTEIKAQAFGSCQSLKSVKMGYVPNVSADIFNLCSNLESVVFDSKKTYDRYLDEGVFSALTASLSYDPVRLEPWALALIIVAAVGIAAAAIVAVFVLLRNKKRRAAATNYECGNVNANYENGAAATLDDGNGAAGFPDTLTRREREIALLMLEGKKRKDIVTALFISDNTVKTHIANILDKAGCGSRMDFIIKYNGHTNPR